MATPARRRSRPALDRRQAAAELLRRKRARESLAEYARAIEIPGAPTSDDPDEERFQPVETALARHHYLILSELQRTMETPYGRLMLFLPPGSAKSTYATVVGPTWALGKWPGHRIIATSYGKDIIRRHSRRARQIVRSPEYSSLWPGRPSLSPESASATEWALTNGSDFYASGLTGGITGNRAHGIVIDDPIAGRSEADSDTVRTSTREAYEDDLEYRLIPGGWIVLMMTRWHEDDLAGGILPEGWAGQSGDILCRDGRTWRVICVPAEADRDDDPLGRKAGEMLWPEWFDEQYWESAKRRPRTWWSQFQQKPRPVTGGYFERDNFRFYREEQLPKRLTVYMAGDFAVTERADKANKGSEDPDRTELGIWGVDERNELWLLDWWWGEVRTDEAAWAWLNLVHKWRPVQAWDEGGVIDKAIRPLLELVMREGIRRPPEGKRKLKPAFTALDSLPSLQDKKAKVASFRGRAQQGMVHLPSERRDNHGHLIGERVLNQLLGFLAGGRYDDAVDVCGLIGRGLDEMMPAKRRPRAGRKGLKPYTAEWLEHDAREELQRRRTRYS